MDYSNKYNKYNKYNEQYKHDEYDEYDEYIDKILSIYDSGKFDELNTEQIIESIDINKFNDVINNSDYKIDKIVNFIANFKLEDYVVNFLIEKTNIDKLKTLSHNGLNYSYQHLINSIKTKNSKMIYCFIESGLNDGLELIDVLSNEDFAKFKKLNSLLKQNQTNKKNFIDNKLGSIIKIKNSNGLILYHVYANADYFVMLYVNDCSFESPRYNCFVYNNKLQLLFDVDIKKCHGCSNVVCISDSVLYFLNVDEYYKNVIQFDFKSCLEKINIKYEISDTDKYDGDINDFFKNNENRFVAGKEDLKYKVNNYETEITNQNNLKILKVFNKVIDISRDAYYYYDKYPSFNKTFHIFDDVNTLINYNDYNL